MSGPDHDPEALEGNEEASERGGDPGEPEPEATMGERGTDAGEDEQESDAPVCGGGSGERVPGANTAQRGDGTAERERGGRASERQHGGDAGAGKPDVTDLVVRPGDVGEYELVVELSATLAGDGEPIIVHRRYEALPRQNDTVRPDAVDTNDRLLADPAAVHVHTTFWAAGEHDGPSAGRGGAPGEGDDGPEPGVPGGAAFLRDRHTRWEPADPSALTGESSFEAACRDHLAETAGATYRRGVEAL